MSKISTKKGSLQEKEEDTTEYNIEEVNSGNMYGDKEPLVSGQKSGIKTRYVLCILAFIGFVNVYCMRVNLSVAMVAMVNSTTTNDNSSMSEECPAPTHSKNSSSSSTGEFNWSEGTQEMILGSFFYGYILTQIPGGWLASIFGGKKLFGFGVLCTAVLTLLTPIAARTSEGLFIAVRVLEGIGEGVTFPAMHAMWGVWAPVLERSRLVGITYSGAQLGTVISLPISGYLCDSDFLGGWPSVFYVFGALACIWFVVWMLLTHDTPAQHPRISDEERRYIEHSVGDTKRSSPPWKSILLSPAVWAICVAHFANNWGFYTLLTSLPSYMKNILHFDVKENGLLSAIPYLVSWIMQGVSGLFADWIRTKQYMSTRNVRKLFTSLALILPGVFLILVGFVGCDNVWAVLCLTLSVGSGGFMMGGAICNHLDLSPQHAGVMMGLSNGIATIPGFAGPALVGALTDNNNTRAQWRIVFYVAAGVYLFGTIFYVIFGKGEEQTWSHGFDASVNVAEPEADDPYKKRASVLSDETPIQS